MACGKSLIHADCLFLIAPALSGQTLTGIICNPDMESFKINLVGENLSVSANENGSFTILKDDQTLGTVTPEPTDSAGTLWTSREFTKDQAMQIGELIEEALM